MSFKKYALIMLIATMMLWGLWIVVLMTMNPLEDGSRALFLFYGSLLLSLTGTFALIGAMYRNIKYKKETEEQHAIISFRHAIWFAFIVNFSFFLQSKRLFTALNLLLFIMLIAIIEFLILSHQHARVSIK